MPKKNLKLWFAPFVALMMLVATGARAELPDFTGLVKDNSAAVVNISTTQKTEGRRTMVECGMSKFQIAAVSVNKHSTTY